MTNVLIFCAKYLFILSPVVVFYFFYKSDAEIRKRILVLGALSLPLSYILGVIGRMLYFNPRPFMVSGVEPLISHAADNGFPSDHTLLLASIASLVFIFNRKLAAWLWVITILVGISRVYAGVHHFIDILGSISIAIASTALVYVIIRKLWNKNNQAH
ncbi:MAG TPA: phosphatase PAP2 family protein [Candidatus Paceibacterota bacterium]